MSYTVHYHPDVPNDIASFPQNIKMRIRKAIEQRLSKDPLRYGLPLRQSLKGYRKMRVGDYRVIYRIASNEIIILKIGHRKEIYKKERQDPL